MSSQAATICPLTTIGEWKVQLKEEWKKMNSKEKQFNRVTVMK